MEKRIYSLNLVAWLKSKGHKQIEIKVDKENNKKYYVFAETDDVARDIEEYRKNRELHEFIRQFKEVKKEIKEEFHG
ncbi:DUF5659 domain-containing protein [Caminicella sporogenes]|uniref:DUF5659 domain-containing protein n=1 Tax=Caminicella sporogenes TaxID=166485 RepID=UPI002541FA7B|nr:DUF5659 domain-containing protein [Caminicella sporogenes]WIF94298.1 DUF5659 domain-containing protein [Caminicella sporogenes]